MSCPKTNQSNFVSAKNTFGWRTLIISTRYKLLHGLGKPLRGSTRATKRGTPTVECLPSKVRIERTMAPKAEHPLHGWQQPCHTHDRQTNPDRSLKNLATHLRCAEINLWRTESRGLWLAMVGACLRKSFPRSMEGPTILSHLSSLPNEWPTPTTMVSTFEHEVNNAVSKKPQCAIVPFWIVSRAFALPFQTGLLRYLIAPDTPMNTISSGLRGSAMIKRCLGRIRYRST